MPDDDDIGIHRLDITCCVDQGFTLGRRTGGRGDIERVGTHPLGGYLERRSRSG
ncbi:hypothetical protein LDC_3018 [sediment metagenome]|uniref:Uncharacterized protein n=1 Tax=sediment metagenome TaxID=749907 RepID=D9PN89_9ZZZZ